MTHAPRLVLSFVAAAALAGCPAESPAPPPASSAPAVEAPAPGVRPATSARAVAPTAPGTPGTPAVSAQPAPPGSPGSASGLPTPGLNRQALDGLLAQAATATGATDCERAYAGMQIMVQGFAERLGTTPPSPPDRAEFLAGCTDLTPEQQRCLVIGYGVAHREECRATLGAIPPEKAARLRNFSAPRP